MGKWNKQTKPQSKTSNPEEWPGNCLLLEVIMLREGQDPQDPETQSLPENEPRTGPQRNCLPSPSPQAVSDQIRSDQSLSRVRLFATPWIAARQASLSNINSRSSLRLTSIESVMPSSDLILCRPLLLLPPIPPSIRVFQWVNSSREVAKVLEFQL